MTTLILIRHGETDWNRDRRIQGATDIPLNDTGRRQAHEAALALRFRRDAGERLAIVSSDLSRASETADIIAGTLELDTPRRYAQLRERAYGEAEGMQIEEFARRWGSSYRGGVPGAEEPAALRTRARKALATVVADLRRSSAPSRTTLIVVAHGGLIREIIGHATGDELPRPGERLANGSAHEVRYERERLTLLSYAPPVLV
ncbi:histidine phosphatase family protein [Microbacterium sp. Marseille-Q6648]|uniref:histidine phosphatase family protein n=1 Tax=Microbacterium sp. Marseille-Q6648 TaxID=2937991 RepID=UPI00203EF0D3|nr:histidine phosphatase family protein [Microbacterium sp. Marseille-Q6648]